MNTSDFLNALRARPELPLAFSTNQGTVPAGFHLTEVKRVTHETVDCGSETHQWIENQFELWAPAVPEPDYKPFPAGKFLAIVDEVKRMLTLDETAEARIFGRVAGGLDQLHAIESVKTGSEAIQVHLQPVTASCKARDRRSSALNTGESCCSSGSESSVSAGCECPAHKTPPSDADVFGYRPARDTGFTPFESQGFRFMF